MTAWIRVGSDHVFFSQCDLSSIGYGIKEGEIKDDSEIWGLGN